MQSFSDKECFLVDGKQWRAKINHKTGYAQQFYIFIVVEVICKCVHDTHTSHSRKHKHPTIETISVKGWFTGNSAFQFSEEGLSQKHLKE